MDHSIEKAEGETMTTPVVENLSAITLERVNLLIEKNGSPQIGYLIWTKPNIGKKMVGEYVRALEMRGIHHIRTGISWAEWRDPQLREWIVWYIREYARYFTVLPCLTFTPPELGLKPQVNAPPRNLGTYAEFVTEVIDHLGDVVTEVELWNEWNLNTDWDPGLDPDYKLFSQMVCEGARVCRSRGKRPVLGGMSKVNNITLDILQEFGESMGSCVDIIGFHNLRGTWSDHKSPPPLWLQAEYMQKAWGKKLPVYLTEYGFPPVDPEKRFNLDYLEDIQVALFAYATYICLLGSIERVYWYTYKDEVSPSLRFVTTGWEDVLQHYFGDTREDGVPRKLGSLLLEGGPLYVLRYATLQGLLPLVDNASLGRKIPPEYTG